MDEHAYLDALRSEGARLGCAARGAGMAAPVPTCPGWSVADLLAHTAGVYRHKTHLLRSGAVERPTGEAWRRPARPPGEAAAEFDEELAALVDALAAVDPATPSWTWGPAGGTAAFWFRRMAQETVVHRADAEAAAGAVSPVATDLAVDGVDEVLDLFLVARVGPGALGGPPATVHLHATDGPGEWLVHLGPEGLRTTRGHAKGDAAARGSASDLLLWLWGRVPGERLERFGDEAAIARLRAAAATAT